MVAQLPEDAGASTGYTIVSGGSTKLSKRIGWLNANGGLAMQIKYSEVKDILSELGEASAMKMLKELEEKRDSVRDPTAYLKAAARRAAGGGVGGMMAVDAYTGMAAPAPAAGAASTDVGARLKKRIGWLNANVALQEQLIYDKVGPLLIACGDREAMDILKKLEEGAADVRDPTGWVITAARRLLAGGGSPAADAAAWGGMAAASHPSGPVRGVIRTIPNMKSGAGSAVLVSQLKKRIGWLNSNVPLREQIVYDKVGQLLVSAGYRQAMEILKHVEEKADSVNDPTAYIANAARRATATAQATGGGAALMLTNSGATTEQGAEEKIRRRITWLNSHVALAAPLSFEKVAGALQTVDTHQAMTVLKQLEENAGTVNNPDAWVLNAVQNALNRRAAAQAATAAAGGDVGMGYDANGQAIGMYEGGELGVYEGGDLGGEPGAYVSGDLGGYDTSGFEAGGFDAGSFEGGGFDGGAADEKIRKRVGWLNRNAQLAGELRYERVAPVLLALESHVAMEVLKSLEANAATVRDPTAYVVSAAQKRLEGGGLPGTPAPARPAHAAASNPADERLRKRIGWLNRHANLATELRYDQVSAVLQYVSPPRAMEILKALEESADSIPDPNAWVLAAAAEGGPEPHGDGTVTPEEKLKRRITWMNTHLTMVEPLSYDRLAPELLLLDPRQAMDVLKKLEENIMNEADPNGSVLTTARQKLVSPGAGAAENPGQQAAPNERLSKRVSWLNLNVSLSSALDYDQIAPHLLRLEVSQAMAVLKALEENAPTVLDPNAYVQTASDNAYARALAGGAGAPSGDALDDALRKRVAWMNANVPLATPLNYDLIAPALLALGDRARAMEVLKALEGRAMEVSDPNENVLTTANMYLAV